MPPARRKEMLARLRRISGQAAALERMFEAERDDAQLVVQIRAVRAALAEVNNILLAKRVEELFAAALADRRAGNTERNGSLWTDVLAAIALHRG